MTYHWLVWVGLLFMGEVFFDHPLVYSAEKAKPTVVVSDVLANPGNPVQLQARVFESGLLGRELALGGETLDFVVEGQVIGSTMTGGDGRAFYEFTPRMRGDLSIKVVVQESSRISGAEGTGLLASWERRKPILLIDFPAIRQEAGQPELPLPSLPIDFSSKVLGEPEQEAPDELEKLGRFYYNIVYLYRTEVGDKEALQKWIQTHHFPSGYPVIIQPGRQALDEFILKMEEDGWENVTAGVGRSVDFAEALVDHRLTAVILHDPQDKEEFPRRAILIENWGKVRKHL